ncbi:hypothetical protein MKL26_00390 [Streptococcus suis]|nr:hypothetical protein [Streptococcus suis]
MKKITIAALLSLIPQIVMPINNYVLANDFSSTTKIVSTELEIPDNVPNYDIIFESEDRNIYKVKNIIELTNSDGDIFTADGIVENEIISEDDEGILGTTTYEVDLSELENVNTEDSFLNTIGNLLTTKVYADSNETSSNSTWDNSISVKLNMTVYWRKYNSGHINITRVTGSYYKEDPTVAVTGSNLFVTQGMPGEHQERNYNIGTNRSWSYSTGFSKVGNVGWPTRKYAKYTVNLKRGGSTWTAVLDNVLGG